MTERINYLLTALTEENGQEKVLYGKDGYFLSNNEEHIEREQISKFANSRNIRIKIVKYIRSEVVYDSRYEA